MIRNQWYGVLESNEVKRGRITAVTRMSEKLVFWRDTDDHVVCMRDLCPHLGAPLRRGKLKDGHLACPFHGFEFDPGGACVYLPAYGRNGEIPKALKVGTYLTHEVQGMVFIYWGDPSTGPQPPKFFESIGEGFSFSRVSQHWSVHYSRMVENQLDVSHLPFIHASTIGRGGRMVVDGPLVEMRDGDMEIWVYNRRDDGTPPRKAEELPPPTRHPFLQFRFPNLWHNWISDDVRVTAMFAPVDEENGVLYLRFYQRFMSLPVLRDLVNLVGKWGNIVIANQDRRIVSHQMPKKTDLKMGEKIMQSDRAILLYRQQRHRLQKEAGQV
ncbi:MAG: aromatic ring-hydroxylating dioxygenase subunit alpha [Anaerolineae bacterium]|nr:aromatic ring-hydroxylating dioxygenase subunit alpha [Anaerolineae bacterium]